MADHTITEFTKTIKRIDPVSATIELDAGESLSDKAALMEFINKTVPTGKKATVKIRISATVEDV